MKRLLIIEDDPALNANIREALQAEGFEVEAVFDGSLAEKLLEKNSYDCLVLDISLPHKNGYDVCRDFRKHDSTTPVLMLTAFDELEDKVKGYNSGADDYLTKPFYMRELALRVQALIKRSGRQVGTTVSQVLVAGDLAVDLATKKVTRQDKEIPLTPREYQILLRLLRSPGELVSKKELVREIWGSSFDANTNTIEVYINFLRNKIDKPFGKESIKTRIGFGYYFE